MNKTLKTNTTASTEAAKTTHSKPLTGTGAPLEAVKAIADNMQDNLNDMLAACKTKEERTKIQNQFAAARKNYDDCLNHAFQQNDAELTVLTDQANASAAEIKAIDLQLGNITKVISILTTAVTYGSKIAAKILPV